MGPGNQILVLLLTLIVVQLAINAFFFWSDRPKKPKRTNTQVYFSLPPKGKGELRFERSGPKMRSVMWGAPKFQITVANLRLEYRWRAFGFHAQNENKSVYLVVSTNA